jgi:hypothetical protein
MSNSSPSGHASNISITKSSVSTTCRQRCQRRAAHHGTSVTTAAVQYSLQRCSTPCTQIKSSSTTCITQTAVYSTDMPSLTAQACTTPCPHLVQPDDIWVVCKLLERCYLVPNQSPSALLGEPEETVRVFKECTHMYSRK